MSTTTTGIEYNNEQSIIYNLFREFSLIHIDEFNRFAKSKGYTIIDYENNKIGKH